MSELEKIQRLLCQNISALAEFSDISILGEHIDALQNLKINTTQILVMRLLPTSMLSNTNAPVFDRVDVKIKISVPIYENCDKSAMYYAEKLSSRLHNNHISTQTNCGKLLLAQNNPIEILYEKPNIETIIVRFFINGIKI